jgi:uncharacterized surface protein with fasciclin (FAS1) repeats
MFKFLKIALFSTLLLATTFVFANQGNIIEVAKKAGDFKTLLTAIKVANLKSTLEGKGPFTVFAPTDEAFAALPKATLDQLLKNPKALANVLTYHVISGEVTAKDVKTGDVKTVNGQMLHVNVDGKAVMVNNAKVIKTDIKASNGIIHVINKVLIPSS